MGDNWVKINKSIAKGQQYKPLQLIEEKPEKIIEPVTTIATKKIPQCCKCKSISDQAYMEHCYQCNQYFHYACCEPVILLTHKSSINSKNYLWQCADCEDDDEKDKIIPSGKRRCRTKSTKYPEKNYHSPPAKKKRKVPPKIEVKIEPEIKEEPEDIPAQVPVKNKKVPAKHPSSTNSQSQVPVKKMRKEKVVLKIIEDVPVKKEVPLKKGVAKK